MLVVGDLFVFNDYQEKSPVYRIVTADAAGSPFNGWQVRSIIPSHSQLINFNPVGQEKNIVKIKHTFSLNFLGDRDPWDFFLKLANVEKFSRNDIETVINNRDYEIMNWILYKQASNIEEIITQDIIDDIVKKGDLLMIDVLRTRNLLPSQECLTWAIESNLTKIFVKLMFMGVQPDIRAVNWACLNLPASSIELILIAGFFPDTEGVKLLKDSEYLHKQILVDIFELQ